MAVPKRKMSRSNTRSRRSQWKAELTELQTVRVQGREVRIPRKLAKAYKNGLLADYFVSVRKGPDTSRIRALFAALNLVRSGQW